MKATVTMILIVLPVSVASNEVDTRLFQVVLDLGQKIGIIAIKFHHLHHLPHLLPHLQWN